MTLCHTMGNAQAEFDGVQSEKDVFSYHTFPQINTDLLTCIPNLWQKQPLGLIFRNGNDHFTIVCWQEIEQVGNCVRLWCDNALNRWKICCIMNFLCFIRRKSFQVGNVVRGIYMFIIWKNFGAKLCLRWGYLKQVSLYLTNREYMFSRWAVASKFTVHISC
jgi:hypothetical protein